MDLTLVNPAATGNAISAISTVVHYDPEELRFMEVVWNPDADPGYPGAAITQDVDAPDLGELTLMLYQNVNPPVSIGDGVRLASLKFAIRNIGDVAENPPRPSKGVRLTQSQTTALNLINQDVFIEGLPGDIMIIRPCNTLTGDCDCSGAVRLREVQGAAQELLTPSLDVGGNPATPRCMKINGTRLAMDATDMQRIVNNHIYQVIESTCSISGVSDASANADGPAWIPMLDIVDPAANAAVASLSFGEPVSASRGVTTDFLLKSGGQAIAAVTIDLRYDPSEFSALTVTPGEVVRTAGKSLSFNIVEPGWMRILVYGLNSTTIPDGVLGTLILTPAVDLEQSGASLQQTPTASTPNATPVPIQGDTLEFGRVDPGQGAAEKYYRKVNAYFYSTFGRPATSDELLDWGSVLRDNSGSVWSPAGQGLQHYLSHSMGWGIEPLDREAAIRGVDAIFSNLFGSSGDIDLRIKNYYIDGLINGYVRHRGLVNAILNDLAIMPRIDGSYGQPSGWTGGTAIKDLLTGAQFMRYRERVEAW